MIVDVKFRTETPTASMTREQATTWLLGCMTAEQSICGAIAALAVSASTSSMVKTLQHNSGKCITLTTGNGEKWELTCTRTGRIIHRTYRFHAERV